MRKRTAAKKIAKKRATKKFRGGMGNIYILALYCVLGLAMTTNFDTLFTEVNKFKQDVDLLSKQIVDNFKKNGNTFTSDQTIVKNLKDMYTFLDRNNETLDKNIVHKLTIFHYYEKFAKPTGFTSQTAEDSIQRAQAAFEREDPPPTVCQTKTCFSMTRALDQTSKFRSKEHAIDVLLADHAVKVEFRPDKFHDEGIEEDDIREALEASLDKQEGYRFYFRLDIDKFNDNLKSQHDSMTGGLLQPHVKKNTEKINVSTKCKSKSGSNNIYISTDCYQNDNPKLKELVDNVGLAVLEEKLGPDYEKVIDTLNTTKLEKIAKKEGISFHMIGNKITIGDDFDEYEITLA